MRDYKITSAYLALSDILIEYPPILTYNKKSDGIKSIDVWTVTGKYLYNKQSRKLNKLLGIQYINSDCIHINKKLK